MRFCCCFCGKEIEEFSNYRLVIQKSTENHDSEAPSQELYCHEKCLEDRLYDANWLYLKQLQVSPRQGSAYACWSATLSKNS